MKKISLLLASVISMGAMAQLKFTEGKFNYILEQARKENKPAFISAYTSWCAYCKKMEKDIYPNTEVGDFYNSNFISAKYDMEKGEGVEIAKKYGIKVFPYYMFLNGDGEVIYTGTGYYNKNDFIDFGKKAIDPKNQIAVLKKKFEEGVDDLAFLKNLLTVFSYSEPDFAQKVMERYFNRLKGSELSREDLGLLVSNIPNAESPLFKIFQERKAEIAQKISEKQYENLTMSFYKKDIIQKAYDKENKILNEVLLLNEAKKVMSENEANKFLQNTKMRIAFSKKEYQEYAKLAQNYYGDAKDFNDTNELNQVAWRFYEHISDKKALQQAVIWAEKSVALKESYANTDTLAHLYYKLGDKKNTQKWATRSVELGKAAGEDVKDTEKLLK